MKNAFRSFTSFTRTERMGVIALCALLVLLLGIRLTMHLWVHPLLPSDREQKLIATWDSFKHKQNLIKDTIDKNKGIYKDAYDDDGNPLPTVVDVNSADSSLLVRLRGIGPATAHRILEWRRTRGLFATMDQFYEAAAMPKPTRELLEQHLEVSGTSRR